MADLTITLTVRGSVGGQSFAWSRDGVVSDISSASVIAQDKQPANGSAQTMGAESGFAGNNGSPHDYIGIACGIVAGTGNNGAMTYEIADPTNTEVLVQHMPHGFPFIVYAGYDFNGGLFESASATDVPQDDIAYLSASALVGKAKFHAIIANKAVS